MKELYTKAILEKIVLSSHSCHFVEIQFFNHIPSCICSIVYIAKPKYQIAESKAVVGVDRSMKALSMHKQMRYYGKLSKFS